MKKRIVMIIHDGSSSESEELGAVILHLLLKRRVATILLKKIVMAVPCLSFMSNTREVKNRLRVVGPLWVRLPLYLNILTMPRLSNL